MRIKILISGIIILFSKVEAQLNNQAFYSSVTDSLATGQFSVRMDHLNFTRNNEYFNKITDGYTLFGFHLMPTVRYQANPEFSIETGAFFWKDYGAKGFQSFEPVLTALYKSGNHRILMGTLDGGLAHRMIEPLYEFENQLNRRLEYGLQWKFQRPGLFCDAWIDWRTMIYPRSDRQEEVLGGWHFNKEVFRNPKFMADLSFQGSAYHKGGQIDTVTTPLTTWFHGAPGVSFNYFTGGKGFFRAVGIQSFAVGFLDYSFYDAFSYRNSVSPYLNFSVETKHGTLLLSYWESSGYPSYQGGRLYRTVSSSVHTPGFQEKRRQLLLIRFLTDFKVGPDIWITSRLEPYYDLQNKFWEFNHGFYINFRGRIWKSKPILP